MRSWWLSVIVFSIALGGCKCANSKVQAPHAPAGSLSVAPIPEAPAITVEQEPALPGSSGAVAVVAAHPKGEASGDFHPTITFNQPMTALATVDEQKKLPPPAHIDPAVPGEWRWLGSASVEFVPAKPLPYSTEYTVTVPAGLASVAGTKLAADYSFQFSTPRPLLQNVEPSLGTGTYKWLTPTQTFTLLFNQPVEDLAGHLQLRVDGVAHPMKVVKEVDVAEETRQAEEAELAKQGQARRFDRQPLEEKTFRNWQTRYEVVPVSPLPLDSPVELIVDAHLRGKQGPLTLNGAEKRDFRTYGPMKADSIQPCGGGAQRCNYGPALVFTTNEIDLATLRGKVTIEPKVEVDWDHAEASMPEEWAGSEHPFFSLPGKYKPGTAYKVSIAAGAKDVFGQVMPAADGDVHTDDLEPYFNAGESEALLERAGDGSLPVESANLDALDVTLWKLSESQMAGWLGASQRNAFAAPPTTPTSIPFDVSGAKNLVHTRPLALKDALDGGGLFVVRLHSNAVDRYRQNAVVTGQLTDLAVHSKLGATSGLVWVTRLSDGTSVPGAELAFWSKAGEKLWGGTTDADGLAKTPGLADYASGKNFYDTPFVMVSATKDGDTGVTVSSWTGGYSAWAYNLQADFDGNQPKGRGMVIADRGIYRPGATFYVKGLVRYRKLGAFGAWPDQTEMNVSVTSPRGKEIENKNVTLSAYGSFDDQAAIPKDAPLGEYRIKATTRVDGEELIYDGTFRVEEYRPPQFKVDVTAPKKDVIAGDPLEATVLARYLFGGTMSGADVTWSVNRTTTPFTPPGNEGFSFGENVWGWDDQSPGSSSDVFASGTGKTDGMGVFTVQAGKAESPTGRTYSYTVEAEVADISRQRIANRVEVTVHPAASYAGLRNRSTGWFGEAGKAADFELVAVDPAGARQEGVHLDLKVQRREWKFIRKKGVGDRWTYEEQKSDTDVSSCSVLSEKTPKECAFTPAEPGLYILSATATDAAGRKAVTSQELYVIGNGWVSWNRNEGDKLDLVADKALYGVGDTAHILVKSPFPEADAVLTVEREGVLTAKRVHLKGAATALEVPIDETLVPNAYVGVVLVRGRVPEKEGAEVGDDPGRPAVRVGYTQLIVEKKSKRLSVTVTPDSKEKRPREKVKVDLAVADWKGKGTQSEVTVWAVDEGVLRLTGYETPDPIDAMHPKVGLSVRIGEPLLHLVARRKYGDKGAATGGSGGMDSTGTDVRRNFKTTVFFAPAVLTDATGHARVEFELPDNLTTFRIMAVAATKEDRFGSGESSVSVSKPILALPALPRFARVGDRFEAGVVIHSPGAKVALANVSAKADGLTLSGPAEQAVPMPDGKPREVRFQFVAEKAGTATLTFRVQGGGESDAVEQKIPVVLPVSMEAVAVYGDTKDTRHEGIVPPSGVRPGVGGLDVTLSSTILGGFSENMRQLVEYPYGCLEQLTSRLIPFVELRNLAKKYNVDWPSPSNEDLAKTAREEAFINEWLGGPTLDIYGTKDPDVVIKATISAIEKLQNHDGGFRYWEDSGCSSDWTSAYAVLVLKRAKDAGFEVDDAAIVHGQDYLADTVAAGRCTQCGWYCAAPGDATRINALYALARTGKPKASYYPELFKRRDKLPLFAMAMLDDAMFVGGGDRKEARQLFDELMNHAKETARDVHFEEADALTYAPVFSSDPRTTAIVLQTLTDVQPDHPYVSKIGNYLAGVRKGDGRYRNTQEAAFSLMALSEVVATKEKETPDFEAKVTLGKETLASAPFHGRTMGMKTAHVDVEKIAAAGSGKLPFDFSKEGPGVLYYGALLRYAPAALPLDALDRGMIVQRWFEPWQGGGQIMTVRAGDLVRVRVRIATSQERHWVAIEVPLPAGLEGVDTTLASTVHEPVAKNEEADDSEEEEGAEDTYADGRQSPGFLDYAGSFWSPFNHTEMRDDRVVLFSDHLPPGVHVASFVARATTPGEFVLQPAHAEEMYTPEVFGRSTGGTFRVIDAAEVAGGE